MKTRFVKQFLTAALAATLAFTSVVPAYAAENTDLLQETTEETSAEDVTVEDNNEETTIDNNAETPAQNVSGENSGSEQQNAPVENEENNQQNAGDKKETAETENEETQSEDAENEDIENEEALSEDDETKTAEPESEDKGLVGDPSDVSVTVNIHAGDHGRYEDPYEALSDVKIGDSLTFWMSVNGMDGGYNEITVFPDFGYTIEGIYLDEECTKPCERDEDAYEWNGFRVTEEAVGEDNTLDLYINWTGVTTRISYSFENGEYGILEGTYGMNDMIPALKTPEKPGYVFMGFYGPSAEDPSNYIQVFPGQMKISELDYSYWPDYDNGDERLGYYTHIYAKWRSSKTYNVTFHLIMGEITYGTYPKTYRVEDRGSKLSLHDGTLSDNSTCQGFEDAGFQGWVTLSGDRQFSKNATVEAVINYMEANEINDLHLNSVFGEEAIDDQLGKEITIRAQKTTNGSFYFNYHGTNSSDTTTAGALTYPDSFTSFTYNKSMMPSYADERRMVFIPKPGYELEGVYLDREHTVEITSGSDISEIVKPYLIDEGSKKSLTLYPDWKKIEISVYLDPSYQSDKAPVGTIGEDRKFPDLGPDPTKDGAVFLGWSYYYHGERKQVKSGDAFDPTDYYDYSYCYDYDAKKGYYVNLYSQWSEYGYVVNYHFDDSDDGLKVTKRYSNRDLNTSLDLSKGSVSDNNAFMGMASDFLGWKTKDGKQTFTVKQTIKDVAAYAVQNCEINTDIVVENSKGNYVVDLYGQWAKEDKGSYTVEFRAFKDDADLTGISAEDFSGAYTAIAANKPAVTKESVEIGESIILDGTEYVWKGHKLTGWKYEGTKNGKPVSGNLTAKKTIVDLVDEGTTLKLTASWSAETEYNVKYVLCGGKFTGNAENSSLPAKYKYSDPLDLTKYNDQLTFTGGDFIGWYLKKELKDEYKVTKLGKGSVNAETGDVTLYACFKLHKSTFIFNAGEDGKLYVDGLESGRSFSINHSYSNSLSIKNIVAVKDGNKFSGWHATWKENGVDKAKDFAANATIKNITTEDGITVTFTAKYTPVNYTVAYMLAGGKWPQGYKATTKYNTGTGLLIDTVPAKSGYYFAGWTLTQKGKETTAALSDGAYSAENPVKVTSASVSAASYGNVTLTANYAPVTYKVDYYVNGVKQTVDTKYTTYGYEEKVNFNEIALLLDKNLEAGKSIVGFSKTNGGKQDYNITSTYSKLATSEVEPLALYAVIAEDTYTVEYDLDGGKLSKNLYTYKKSNSKVTLPTASKTGYDFKGWRVENKADEELFEYKEGNFFLIGEDIYYKVTAIKPQAAKNVKLVAMFASKSYTIKLDPNGKNVKDANNNTVTAALWADSKKDAFNVYYAFGTGKSKNDESCTIDNLPVWTREGYTFKGFGLKKKSTADEKVTSLKELTTGKSITFYAIWEGDPATLNYQTLGYVDGYQEIGAGIAADQIAALSTQSAYGTATVLPKLSVAGYTFVGWKGTPADSTKADASYNNSRTKEYVTKIGAKNKSDWTLIPCFTENTYKVKLNMGGGYTYTMDPAINPRAKKIKGTLTSVACRSISDADYVNAFIGSAKDCVFKKGYTFRGVYLDSKGKNPVPTDAAGYEGIVKKNKGTITVYVLWDKVSPAKVGNVSATFDKTAHKVKVTLPEQADGYIYEIQVSSSVLFPAGKVFSVTADSTDELEKEISDLYGSQYYVRVRRGIKDSENKYVYGAFSKTVRAIKTAQD